MSDEFDDIRARRELRHPALVDKRQDWIDIDRLLAAVKERDIKLKAAKKRRGPRPWLLLQNGVQAVRITSLERKVGRQAAEITKLLRSRAGLKAENAELRMREIEEMRGF